MVAKTIGSPNAAIKVEVVPQPSPSNPTQWLSKILLLWKYLFSSYGTSYIEIYNERVQDLLQKTTMVKGSLRVREHPKDGPYVQGKTSVMSPRLWSSDRACVAALGPVLMAGVCVCRQACPSTRCITTARWRTWWRRGTPGAPRRARPWTTSAAAPMPSSPSTLLRCTAGLGLDVTMTMSCFQSQVHIISVGEGLSRGTVRMDLSAGRPERVTTIRKKGRLGFNSSASDHATNPQQSG